MSSPSPIVGILLAGGQSRRMGSDKAELKIEGHSLLSRTKTLLQQSGCESVFVSRNNAEGVADIYFNQGPIAGVHAVLNSSGFPKNCLALVVPVDMPLLNTQTLTDLIQQALNSGINGYFDDCYLPCALHIHANTASELELRLKNGQRSVKSYLLDTAAASFNSNNTQCLINTNTPSEWQQACLAYHQ